MNIPKTFAGEPVARLWKTVNALIDENNRVKTVLDLVLKDLPAIKLRLLSPNGLFPFAIYSFPDAFRWDGPDAESWHRFIVRSGRVSDVLAEDVIDSDLSVHPYTDPYPDGDDTTLTALEFNLDPDEPDNAEHWFWITYATGTPNTATINHGAAGWSGFPALDGVHIPIGYVDVYTDRAIKTAHIHQLLTWDIINPLAASCVGGVATTRVIA